MSGSPLRRDVLCFIRRYSSKPAPEREFERLALRIFRFQFENNTLYGRFCEMERATPDRVKHWKRIPAMPALAFKELVLTTFQPGKRKKIFKTSGTTGQTTGAHYFETLELYDASVPPPFRKYVLDGLSDGAFSYYFLMAPASQAPYSSLSYMMGVIDKHLARGKGRFYVKLAAGNGHALSLQGEDLLRDLKKEKKKVLLLSTTFSLKGFLDFLAQKNERLCLPAGSRLMETGGFKGRIKEVAKPALYRACSERLGIPETRCIGEYGMTELSSQYYSRARGLFFGPAWLRAGVVDPESGEECRPGRTGLLKHVDLANLGSVLAVQTEDLGIARAGGFELLGRAAGSEPRGCSLSYERFVESSL